MPQRLTAVKILILSFGLAKLSLANPLPQSGQIYEKGSDHKQLLYQFKGTLKKEPGGDFYTTEYQEPEGEVAVLEEMQLRENKLQKYRITQKQDDTLTYLEVDEGKAIYNRTNQKTGDIKTSKENWTEEHMVLPQVMSFVEDHWDGLMRGNTLHLRLSIPEKMGSYGFKLFMVEEDPVVDKNKITLKLKAASLFYSIFMDPFILTADRRTKRVIQMTGATLPLFKKGPNQFKSFDADTVFDEPPPPSKPEREITSEPESGTETAPEAQETTPQ